MSNAFCWKRSLLALGGGRHLRKVRHFERVLHASIIRERQLQLVGTQTEASLHRQSAGFLARSHDFDETCGDPASYKASSTPQFRTASLVV